jgi:hypothetical protein
MQSAFFVPKAEAETCFRYANAERMDEHASVFILRSFAKQNSTYGMLAERMETRWRARSGCKTRFRAANAERMCLHGKWLAGAERMCLHGKWQNPERRYRTESRSASNGANKASVSGKTLTRSAWETRWRVANGNAGSRVCKAPLPYQKQRLKPRFRYANAERMCLHGKWGGCLCR